MLAHPTLADGPAATSASYITYYPSMLVGLSSPNIAESRKECSELVVANAPTYVK